MLRRKALRKIVLTTSSILILFVIYLIPSESKLNPVNKNIEVNYKESINKNIYVLNEDNLLVMYNLKLTNNNDINKIKDIIYKLTISNNNYLPSDMYAIIPKNTNLLDIKLDNKNLTLNFSKEFNNISKDLENKLLESIVFSITDTVDINNINIKVENKTKYQNLTRNIGINNTYNIDKRNDINKIVVYYIYQKNKDNYYVPVTRYMNDNKEKIEIIMDCLTNKYIYENNLISLLDQNIKLNDYKIKDKILSLNFSEFNINNNDYKDLIVNSITYSIFNNYNVEEIIFNKNNEQILKKIKNALNN